MQNVSIDNNPGSAAVSTVIHLDTLLSEYYGKEIRQGNSFKVKGVQVSLRPVGSGFDTGLSTTVQFAYCPTTKHTRRAWNHVFKQWVAQKKLAGRVGKMLNNDDFETTYSTTYTGYSRTSTLNMGGLNDGDADKVCIYGSSNETTNVLTLEDMYESLNPVDTPSTFSWNGNVIKPLKATSRFPEERMFAASANASTAVDAVDWPAVYLSGSLAQSDMVMLPEPANVLCGHLEVDIWTFPDDTLAQLEDTAEILISIWVESFSPLVYPKKARSVKPRRKSTARRKSSRRKSKR